MIEHPMLGAEQDKIFTPWHKKRPKLNYLGGGVLLVVVFVLLASFLWKDKRTDESPEQMSGQQIVNTQLKTSTIAEELPGDLPYLLQAKSVIQNYTAVDTQAGHKQIVRKWETEGTPEQARIVLRNYFSLNDWKELLVEQGQESAIIGVGKSGNILTVSLTKSPTPDHFFIEINLTYPLSKAIEPKL